MQEIPFTIGFDLDDDGERDWFLESDGLFVELDDAPDPVDVTVLRDGNDYYVYTVVLGEAGEIDRMTVDVYDKKGEFAGTFDINDDALIAEINMIGDIEDQVRAVVEKGQSDGRAR